MRAVFSFRSLLGFATSATLVALLAFAQTSDVSAQDVAEPFKVGET